MAGADGFGRLKRLSASAPIEPAVTAYMIRNTDEPESVPAPRPCPVAAIQTAKLR
jgi:hypothetical protein